MLKKSVLITLSLGLLILILGACVGVTPLPEAQAQYCEDAKAYAASVKAVRDLPAEATVEEYAAALEAVDDAYRALDNSAWDLAETQNAVLRPAYNEMRAGLDEIDKGTPVVEARAIISDALATYIDQVEQVTDFSCRPVK